MGTFLLWFQGDTFNVVQHNKFSLPEIDAVEMTCGPQKFRPMNRNH